MVSLSALFIALGSQGSRVNQRQSSTAQSAPCCFSKTPSQKTLISKVAVPARNPCLAPTRLSCFVGAIAANLEREGDRDDSQ